MERLAEANEVLIRLQALADDAAETPAMVIVAPHHGDRILGNRGGFLRLAIAALKAAEGEKQRFKGENWVYQEDLDWQINGLTPDADAHVYIPKTPSKLKRMGQSILGFVILFLVVICLVVGFITIIRWL